jgi:DNA processing protein
MDDDQLKYQIGLSLIPGIGSILARKLVAYTGSLEGVFIEKKSNLLKIPGIGEHLAERIVTHDILKRAEAELEFIRRYSIKTYFYLDEDFPERLKQCNDAPVILYMKGDSNLNASEIISIVGTRNATPYGRDACEKIVSELAADHPNLIVVSGLAYGIDITAHKAALGAKIQTIAVLGHGLTFMYPAAHAPVAKKIVHQGALITDFLSDENPEKNNFIKRNRIIAGLADATLVIESGLKGGALITADIANSYDRDVLAIPGRINEKYSAGCNQLIKSNKAALVESARDIEYLLGWDIPGNGRAVQQELFPILSPEEELLYDIIKTHGAIVIDDICEQSGFPVSKVSALLLNIEFNGYIKSLPGKAYSL